MQITLLGQAEKRKKGWLKMKNIPAKIQALVLSWAQSGALGVLEDMREYALPAGHFRYHKEGHYFHANGKIKLAEETPYRFWAVQI